MHNKELFKISKSQIKINNWYCTDARRIIIQEFHDSSESRAPLFRKSRAFWISKAYRRTVIDFDEQRFAETAIDRSSENLTYRASLPGN